VTDRERWAAAVPLVQAALAEVGYPSKFQRQDGPQRENALHFDHMPPPEMLQRAAQLAGIGDLMERAL
jgi:hypothetical protein